MTQVLDLEELAKDHAAELSKLGQVASNNIGEPVTLPSEFIAGMEKAFDQRSFEELVLLREQERSTSIEALQMRLR